MLTAGLHGQSTLTTNVFDLIASTRKTLVVNKNQQNAIKKQKNKKKQKRAKDEHFVVR